MITKSQKKAYEGFKTYEAKPMSFFPLIENVSTPALIAWFRCNSCYTCRWREEVIEKDIDPDHDIDFCSRMHDRENIIDMVSYLGYSKEGREKDIYPN